MGTKIEDVVDVQITKATAKIVAAGFGTPLVFGIHTAFVEDYRVYGNIDAVLEDFVVTDEEYKAALALFSQELSPSSIIIGKRAANVAQQNVVTVAVAAAGDYDVTINGTLFQFTAVAESAIAIATALVGLIVADLTLGVTPTDNLDGTFDLDADVAGAVFTLVVTHSVTPANITEAEAVANVNAASTLAAFNATFSAWYALVLTRRATEAEQLQDIAEAAAWIETQDKLYAYAIGQASAITAVTTDIFSLLQALAYDNTFGMYNGTDASYPEAAWLGRCLPEKPGSITWKFWTLSGVTPDVLSDTAVFNLDAKNANFYETVAGVNNVSSDAVVASGEYIDVIRSIDWMVARIGEAVYTSLLREKKIPFTIQGADIIENDIRSVLDLAVTNGVIVDGSAVIVIPDIDSVSEADKNNRLLDDVTFTAQLQGAIHKVIIRGTVTV